MRSDAQAEAAAARLEAAVRAVPPSRYLLAVSGGRDSMVLMDAFTRWRSDAVGAATFDHGTGRHAQQAAQFVEREGARRGLPVTVGRLGANGAMNEAAWRAARWAFLRESAQLTRATVATAHTIDDQLETVVMRALRDGPHEGTRGLAGMFATGRQSVVARPFLEVSRADVASYARVRKIRYLEDPTNTDFTHLRNRVRGDLLPALERASPGFGAAMLRLSRDAARWRATVDEMVDGLGTRELPGGGLVIPADPLRSHDSGSLAVLWPAVAERAGIRLDRRGIARLVAFTRDGRPAGQIQLSGGGEARRTEATFVLRAQDVRG